jgi:hypothetical protein
MNYPRAPQTNPENDLDNPRGSVLGEDSAISSAGKSRKSRTKNKVLKASKRSSADAESVTSTSTSASGSRQQEDRRGQSREDSEDDLSLALSSDSTQQGPGAVAVPGPASSLPSASSIATGVWDSSSNMDTATTEERSRHGEHLLSAVLVEEMTQEEDEPDKPKLTEATAMPWWQGKRGCLILSIVVFFLMVAVVGVVVVATASARSSEITGIQGAPAPAPSLPPAPVPRCHCIFSNSRTDDAVYDSHALTGATSHAVP